MYEPYGNTYLSNIAIIAPTALAATFLPNWVCEGRDHRATMEEAARIETAITDLDPAPSRLDVVPDLHLGAPSEFGRTPGSTA